MRNLARALALALWPLVWAAPVLATDWTFNWGTAAATWPLAGWTTTAWPACGSGTVANSRTFTNVSASNIDVKVTLSIKAGCFIANYPLLDYAAIGGGSPSPADMNLNVNFSNRSNSPNLTVRYEFFVTGTTTPVTVAMTGLAVRDIDRQTGGGDRWQDVVTMTAVNGSGTTINPDFISQFVANGSENWTPASPAPAGTNTLSGIGDATIASTDQRGWATFVFGSQKIRSMSFVWTPGDGGGAGNPDPQRVFLSGFVFSDVAITTQALVSDMRAYVEDGQPWVEWETASEVGTAGFNVYRLDPASQEFVPLNDRLLPALIGSPYGGIYRYPDANVVPGGTYTYQLEEVEARGISRKYRPFTVIAGAGNRAAGARRAQPLLPADASVRADQYTRRAHAPSGRAVEPLVAGGLAPPPKDALTGRPGTTSTAARILVEHDGLYAVTADAIAAALGTNLQQVRSLIGKYQLRLQQRGQPVAWMADPGNERLYFYGQAVGSADRVHTRYNVYWLDLGAGLAMTVLGGNGPAPVAIPQDFLSRVHAKKRSCPRRFSRPIRTRTSGTGTT